MSSSGLADIAPPSRTIMVIERLRWNETPSNRCRGGALTIGNFDGVHRGHVALLAELRRQAVAVGGPAVVLTFDPHPLQLLRPTQFMPVLTPLPERARLLSQAGADCVLVLETTPHLLGLSAREFFDEVIRRRVAARALVEGPNFAFGRGREGTIETLARLGREHGISFTVVEPQHLDGVMVSSSRVRDALVAGDVRAASELLGRPYRIAGTVGVGRRRGGTIGFPTANLYGVQTVVPRDGVYAVRAWVGETPWPAAANLGPNPTFEEPTRKIEVHLIGYSGDLYDRTIAVDFLERLRDTRSFASVAELVEQVRRDVVRAAECNLH